MRDSFKLEILQKNNTYYLFGYAVMALACAFFLVARYTGWFEQPGLTSEQLPEYVDFITGKRFVTLGYLEDQGYGYALLERFLPKAVTLAEWPSWAFWAAFLPCFAIALACISYSSGFGFYVMITVVTLLTGFFLPDTLFGAGNTVGYRMAQLGLVGLISGGIYFFKEYRTEVSLGHRIFYFLCINLIWFAGAIALGSGQSVHSLAGYAIMPLAVLTVLFILQTSYALPYLGMQLAVRQNINSIISYTVMMVFLGGNLFVYYQHSRGQIEGFLFYLDPLLVLCVAALLGFSMFRDFSDENAGFYNSSHPMGWAFYPVWGAIAMLTVAFAAATDNAPLLEVFEDSAALFGAGGCLVFLFYALVNFWEPMWKSLRVDTVFFHPVYVPVFAIMGLTVSFWVFFFIQNDRYSYRQAVAGRYIALADAAWHARTFQEAELFYIQSMDYDAYAFRPNYMLAMMAGARNNPERQLEFLSYAVKTKARPAAYLALGNYFADRQRFFDAVGQYHAGLEVFPDNPALATNLAVQLASSDLVDSTMVIMQRLVKSGKEPEITQSNLAAMLAMKKLPVDMNLQLKADVAQRTPTGQANLALWQASQGNLCSQKTNLSDTEWSFFELFSLVSSCPTNAVPDSAIRMAAQGLPNSSEDVAYLEARRLEASGNIAAAFVRYRDLARTSEFLKEPYYRAAILTAIDRGGVDQARELLLESAKLLPKGLSQSLWLDVAGYPSLWKDDTTAPDFPIAQKLFAVAQTPADKSEGLEEEDRFLWLVANRDNLLPIETARRILSFKSSDLSWSAFAAVAELYIREGDLASLVDLTNRLSGNMPVAKSEDIAQTARIRLLDGWLGSKGASGIANRPEIIAKTGIPVVDAALAELAKPKPATRPIQIALEAYPFRGYLLEAAVARFNALGQPEAGYRLALDAYQLMPETERIARTYILQAARMDYDPFAASALDRYREQFGADRAKSLQDSLRLQPGERPAELSL